MRASLTNHRAALLRPGASAAPRPAVAARFQSAGAADASSASPCTVHFEVAQAVPYGQRVAVLGAAPELGGWDVGKAIPLEWSDANVWKGQAKL
jgi:hypothetical protein